MGELDYQMALLLQHKFNNEPKENSYESSDTKLAKQLQEEFQKEHDVDKISSDLVYVGKKKLATDPSKCLVDPSWEVIDPTPDVHNLFIAFNQRFFWNKLLMVCVSWSKRMTTCAGICSYQGRGGLCSITLSEPLLKLRPRKDLVETLLHEMIHAFLFVTHNNKDRDGHGPEFHKHMYRINGEAGTNITVYHDFHDEVRLYQQHWWKCDGPCQKWKPYFGMVRRAQNRAPGPNDRWWGEHSRNCGGNFIKVKEPEKTNKKQPKRAKDKVIDAKKPVQDIRTFIKTDGKTNSNNKIHTITNINSDSHIVNVIPSKVSNIHGFTNLGRPSSSKVVKGNVNRTDSNSSLNTSNSDSPSSSKIGNPSIKKGILKKTDCNSTLTSSSDTSDYSAVRNHWASKFNDNKRLSTDSIESSPSKIPKLENLVPCPVCNGLVSMKELNSHIDSCLEESNKNQKECIICAQLVPESNYEQHVLKCTEDKFGDDVIIVNGGGNDSKSLAKNKTCEYCNIEISDTDYKEHVEDCSSAYKNTGISTSKTCPACEAVVPESAYDRHVEKCLLKMYDQLDSEYGIVKNEYINCLACDKKVLKVDLENHLEDCMNMSNVFDDSNMPVEDDVFIVDPDASREKKYNCPCCMKLILESEMRSHIDQCLNISDEKDLLAESLDDDF